MIFAAALAIIVVDAGAAIGVNGHHSKSSSPTNKGHATTTTVAASTTTVNSATTTGPTTTLAAPSGTTATTAPPLTLPSSESGGTTYPESSVPEYTEATVPVTSASTVVATTTVPVTPTTVPAATTLPPSGIYTYTTTGSASSPTETHGYPSQTPVTVSTSGSSVEYSWQSEPAASGALSSQTLVGSLGDGGIDVTEFASSGSLYTDRSFTCTDGFLPVTRGSEGQQYEFTCTSSTNGVPAVAAVTVTLDSFQDSTVDGEVVPTTTDTMAVTYSGDQTGSSTATLVLTDNSVIVSANGNSDIDGGAYHSTFGLSLMSLTPTS